MQDKTITNKRGFAALDPETRKAIAASGGKAAQALGKAHRLTTEESRKGGTRAGAEVARDVAHMAEIGRRGGLARQRAARERRQQEGRQGPRAES
jgi:general stress protein YciG